MKKLTPYLLTALLLTLAFPGPASAQHPPEGAAELVLRIDGLTSTERDALTRALPADGSVRLVYACVPAGILILEAGDNNGTRATVREKVMPLATSRIAASRIAEPAIDRAQAEAQCASLRSGH